tara:strand:- start:1533 stop:1979 length:447 start_codon:yes stop_codon:yes gene_type:complete
MDLELKKTIVSYSDTNENNFAIDLWKILKENVKIKVINDVYSSVDYQLTSKQNEKVIYLELKCRDIKYANCNTFIMGKTKIDNITAKCLMPCILIWKFGDIIYFKKYTADLMNYETSIIQNSKVIFIKKCDCDNGMESLIELINKLLN